eukprot:403350119
MKFPSSNFQQDIKCPIEKIKSIIGNKEKFESLLVKEGFIYSQQEQFNDTTEKILDNTRSINELNDEILLDKNQIELQKNRNICEFILAYLEDQYDQIYPSQRSQYFEFCLKVLILNFINLNRKPLLAHGILRKLIRLISKQEENIFIKFSGENYDALIRGNDFLQILNDLFQKNRFTVETPIVILICDLIEDIIQETITEVNKGLIDIFIRKINESLDTDNPLLQRIIAVAYVRMLILKIRILKKQAICLLFDQTTKCQDRLQFLGRRRSKKLFKVLNSEKKELYIGLTNCMQNQTDFNKLIQKALQIPKLKLLLLYHPQDASANKIMTLLSQGKEKYNYLQKKLLDREKDLIGELLVYSLVTFIPCNNKMFFKHLLNFPTNIDEIYFPFNVNTQYDFKYNSYFKSNKNFSRYECVACGRYFLIADCYGKSKEEQNDFEIRLGGNICRCGNGLGFGSVNKFNFIDRDKNQQNFNPENESSASYIYQEPEIYDEMNVRGLNNLTRLIGSIIMHLMILGALILNDENTQKQMQSIYAPEFKRDQSLSRAEHTLNVIIKLIRHSCQQLKQLLDINDDRLKLLIEYVIQKITNNSFTEQSLTVDQLRQIPTRRQFETYFQEQCLPKLNDNFLEFFQTVQEANFDRDNETIKNQQQIEETFNYKELHNNDRDAQMYSLLRIQSELTQKKLIQYLQTNRSKEGDFLLAISDQLENLKTLSQFNHILAWFNYMQSKFDGNVSFEDSLNCNIETIIKKTIQNTDQNYALELFEKFASVWNKVTAKVEIREGYDQIIVPEMHRNQLFQLTCFTNQRKDLLGINFYYVFKCLSDLQNAFLMKIAQLEGFHFLNEQYQKEVRFTELKEFQLISDSFNDESLIKELKQLSTNNIIYGQGKSIEYNIKKLYEKLFDSILKNKVIINISEEVSPFSFNFENPNNPQNQYSEIQRLIPQIRFGYPYQVLEKIRTFEDKYVLLKDLQTTLNFIQQSGGLPTQSLKLYMQSFKVQSSDDIDDGLQIQHVLDLYEQVEDQLQYRLVESVSPLYQEDLRDQDKGNNSDKLQTTKTILGRFIIRVLCSSTSIQPGHKLFECIFDKQNQYLFGIGANINPEFYQQAFKSVFTRVGQSLHAFRYLQEIIKDQEQSEEQQNEKVEENKKRNEQKMQFMQKGQAVEHDAESDENISYLIQGDEEVYSFLDDIKSSSSHLFLSIEEMMKI